MLFQVLVGHNGGDAPSAVALVIWRTGCTRMSYTAKKPGMEPVQLLLYVIVAGPL
jgi:hypothetical protein